ncbi:NAD(P)/FAD-dependent oxidoreductase [Spiroplasma culicicola]|uniref:Ferredoxin--NADP reductase n=1 Tax=Spiroplasma culicicola AES-1 TaxID=1276246 RepID=W6A6C0_9MOLU|nr:NAD(P)/FAD-dependent oxidoreductase [Spiroplasma culicicola]AHI52542.1 thioredoxin reductase [Spiroplasma culicicola AES-1]
MIKDVLIIGCGPTGLYAWKMAADLNLTGTVVEANQSYGGQVVSNYPEKFIYNFPAIPKILGKEGMDQMYETIKKDEDMIETKFNTRITKIVAIQPDEDVELFENWFRVSFSDETEHLYKRIVFTDGIGIYTPIRLCDKNYQNVCYSVKDTNQYKDKDVVIFGGGDSAIDWANDLAPIAKSITIVHRRDEFRAKPGNITFAEKNGVKFLTPYLFDSITEEDGEIAKKLKLVHPEDESKSVEIEFDHIIVQFGQTIKKELLGLLEFDTNKLNKIIVNYHMESSVKGIYAAGDCCWYETKIRNLISGFYEAMHAIINIEKAVHARKILNNGW